MNAMLSGTFKFSISYPDGRREQLDVDAERVLVGSGAHCEIRLPQGLAAAEQLVIEARMGGVFAEARSLDPMPVLDGSPFTQGRLLPEAVIGIGPLSLQVHLVEVMRSASASKEQHGRTNPLLYAAAVLGFPLGIFIILHKPKEAPLTMPVDPPALWASGAVACPQRETAPALALADQELGAAQSKEERAPFYPEDGVSAVNAFRVAGSCFRASEALEQANDAEQLGARLQRHVANDFHIHQVRLERALSTKNYESSRTEVRILRAFLGGAASDYASWLSVLDRRIELKFSAKKQNTP